MENPRQDDSAPPVVRAQRYELVDRRGRTRALLGDLGGPDDGFEPGLELRDRMGHCRMAVCLRREGPMFVLVTNGHEVAGIRVIDDPELTDEEPSYDPVTRMWVGGGIDPPVVTLLVHHDGGIEWEFVCDDETETTPDGSGGPPATSAPTTEEEA